MSLLGNRGRFTQDKNSFFDNENSEFSSVLSLIGKNPIKLFNILKTKNNNENNLKEKLKDANLNLEEPSEVNRHLEYNKSLKAYDYFSENSDKDVKHFTKKRKTNVKLLVAMFVVEALTLVGIYFFGSVYRLANSTQNLPFNKKEIINTEISEDTIKIMKGYKTVAVFGVDSRTGSVDKGNNADVNLIVNLNLENGNIQLISVYRDLYLNISDNSGYEKLNAAYRYGGPEQAVKSLNKNLDLNIDSYFAFNWKAVADGIELLGGIDLEITKSEFTYMNSFIHETCIATGIDDKNPAAHYIKKHGVQHLDGVQAVAYGRLRLLDSDFQRVERQKKVIALCLEKARTLDIPRLRLIVEAVLPQVAHAFDFSELISLLPLVRTVNITASAGCPEVNNVITMNMGANGDCVVPINLEKAVIKLHNVLFNVNNYTPSNSVKRISNKIIELRNKYAEQNKINESLRESYKLESMLEDEEGEKTNSSVPKKRVSTSSNTKATNAATISSDFNVVDADNNIERAENDDTAETTINNSAKPISIESPGQITSPPSSNNDFIEYDAPGVPKNNSSTNQSAPSAPMSDNGVVVSGPPGSSSINNAPPVSETTSIMPVITAPY